MGNRRKRGRSSARHRQPVGSALRRPFEGDTFDARDYVLTTPPEPAQEQEREDFDPREWFLLDVVEPETEEMRLCRLLGEAGFTQLELHAAGEEGAFDFRYRIDNPEVYTTEQVHDNIVAALEPIGRSVVFTQIAIRLEAGITSGTFWLAADAG
jgi:hypothetical protein